MPPGPLLLALRRLRGPGRETGRETGRWAWCGSGADRLSGYARGPVGFVHAWTTSLRDRFPRFDPLPDLGGRAAPVLVSPVRTATVPTPMRAFLAARPAWPPRAGLALPSIGTGSRLRALPRVQAALGTPSHAERAVTGRALRPGAADDRIAAFARRLRPPACRRRTEGR